MTTKQKDGLTYMNLDYQENKNLLDKAIEGNVSRFMYVSVFNADKLRHIEVIKAKERFVHNLKNADVEHIIVRPNGFFSLDRQFDVKRTHLPQSRKVSTLIIRPWDG